MKRRLICRHFLLPPSPAMECVYDDLLKVSLLSKKEKLEDGVIDGLNALHRMSPAALEVAKASIGQERNEDALLEALSEKYRLGRDCFMLAPSRGALVRSLWDALMGPRATALVTTGFELYDLWVDHQIIEADIENGKQDFEALVDFVLDSTRLVFWGAPHYPTGEAIRQRDLITAIQQLPEHTVACVDTSWASFSEDTVDVSEMVRAGLKVVGISDMGPFYGTAGISYMYADAGLIRELKKILPDNGVTAPSLAASAYALQDTAHYALLKKQTQKAKVAREEIMQKIGLHVLQTAGPWSVFEWHAGMQADAKHVRIFEEAGLASCLARPEDTEAILSGCASMECV